MWNILGDCMSCAILLWSGWHIFGLPEALRRWNMKVFLVRLTILIAIIAWLEYDHVMYGMMIDLSA
jgi:hypothetical protein